MSRKVVPVDDYHALRVQGRPDQLLDVLAPVSDEQLMSHAAAPLLQPARVRRQPVPKIAAQ